MTRPSLFRPGRWLVSLLAFITLQLPLLAQETAGKTLDQKIDEAFKWATGWFVNSIFSSIEIAGYDVLWVILWLAAAGLVFTVAFKFINIRAFPLAVRTVRGKYSRKDDPGDVTHFQALTAAVSGTVGLGNIAGVAIGISIAGPGVAFWLFLSGFLGMATKFAECTLGVKYREIDEKGQIHGGGMQYLRKGFAEKGLAPVGVILAILFAIFCVFASFGGGNVFQINQATAQLINVTGGEQSYFSDKQWLFGLIVAIATALVIIGGIRSIARVTSKLVPMMCAVYVVSALIVLIVNAGHIPEAINEIVREAFKPRAAVTGGVLAAFIWGMRRATFSNEAGIGSAPIAHSAAKTRMPASEGVVALLEPFIDTVIVCSMTSLVLVTTMYFDGDAGTFAVNGNTYELGAASNNSTAFGIGITSNAFETVHSGFKYVLFACVLLFAFSTLITWSYYGLQAWRFLFGKFGKLPGVDLSYKLIFCLIIIAGSSASMGSAVDFSDASLFAMSIPNLIGVYFLMPVVARELNKFIDFTRKVDDGETVHEAADQVEAAERSRH
ncbi:sodium/alanine symporter protein [Haloferula helveola]|uniref:Sodium/alanine symporter protein n=1 Tax=Haloferula helveola TaxID=490095 RepID=A0ABN6H7E5_9BACT|nr:sodium/alanine symporter protein [Haloferula helveola]